MGVIGTGVAASVAQTGLQAQQQGRRANKVRGERQRAAADAAAEFVERLEGPADADDPGSELPDRQALGYELLYGPNGALPGASTPGDANTPPVEGDGPVTHLDVRA
ncbi:MAG: hypothetical protein V3V20_10770 [Algisphaera sp.]